jgi:LysM repeat protein
MPSAALLARATREPSDLEKAAESIVTDVLAETPAVAPMVENRAPVRTYRVKSGDTLSGIARRFKVTVNQLKTWNRLRTTNLQVGTRLLLQQPRSTTLQ